MTVKEAARRLEISRSLLYGLVAAGKIRYCRIGNGRGRIRIPEDAIREYLARCTFAPGADEKPAPLPRLRHLRL